MNFARLSVVGLLALVPASFLGVGLAAGPQAAPPAASAQAHGAGAAALVNPDEALKRLTEGNERFVSGQPRSHADDPKKRKELAQSQAPFAVVVCCSDSRVAPELVFDQTLGDLFVIRTAGEVLDDPSLGSIEYAVEHLHSQLLIVVGHERCGAVSAAVASGEAPGHIASIVKAIQPAVQASKGKGGDAIDAAVRENVREVVQHLQATGPILSEAVHAGHLKVVGAYYDLDTGKVELLPAAAH